jgi:AcrR family transcriptional regulator
MSGRAWGAQIQSREEKFELKRQAVLRTAAGLFRTKGVENTTLGDVAEVLHVSKPTVYYYFRNKEEVLLALVEAAVAEFVDPALHPDDYPLVPGASGADRFERFVRRAMRILFGELGSSFPASLPKMLDGERRNQFLAAGKPVEDMAEEILNEGIEDGSFEPCNIAATYRFVIGAIRYIPVWQREIGMAPQDIADAFVPFVMRSLRRAG